jgi:hypothetical protein
LALLGLDVGRPDPKATAWVGIGAPANTPPEITAILNRQVNSALADAAFKARLVDLGMEPFASSPAEFGKFIVEYTEKWGKVVTPHKFAVPADVPQIRAAVLDAFDRQRQVDLAARPSGTASPARPFTPGDNRYTCV